MAQGFAAEVVGVLDDTKQPPGKADGRVYNSRMRRFRATLDLANAAVKRAAGDTNVLCIEPVGFVFAYAHVTGVVTTGTLAIGPEADPARYFAAAALADTKTVVSAPATVAAGTPIPKDQKAVVTIAGAALPATGLIVIDLFYSGR